MLGRFESEGELLLLGAYAGGRVAISIGKQEWVVMTFAVLFTVGIVMNLLVVPSPTTSCSRRPPDRR